MNSMINIKAVTEDDRDSLHILVRNNIQRLLDFFPITIEKTETPEKTLSAIQLYKNLASQNELHVMAIRHNDTKRFIGVVFLKNIDKKVSKCEIAYFIDKGEEGKNYTSMAVLQAIKIAFNQLHLNKIYCRVAPDNAASNRVAIKSGFKLEGVLKQEYCIYDGSLVDINYYGLLKENYN
jgi:ribosomal-protein-serine acetyltransferase